MRETKTTRLSKNWSALAKSMEADMAASMLKQHEENNSENVVRLAQWHNDTMAQ